MSREDRSRTVTAKVYFAAYEKAIVEAFLEKTGETFSSYVRRNTYREAREALTEQELDSLRTA